MELKIEAEVIDRTPSYKSSGKDGLSDRTVCITVGGKAAFYFTHYLSSSDEDAIEMATLNWIDDHIGTTEEI